MAEPYVGEIRMFAGTFAPRGWADADGQLLPVSSNNALFSLYGTIYGGDGRTTFGLPDMRGRLPLHEGNGPGLSDRRLGSKGGSETVTVTLAQLPSHNHQVRCIDSPAGSAVPTDHYWAQSQQTSYFQTAGTRESMGGQPNTTNTGGGQSHTNLMPTITIRFIVSLLGVYPSRS
ncbi:MAG: tail fiber protein [Verrucomicrobiota bacterium]